MELHAIGIDLGKTLFYLVGVDAGGSVVVAIVAWAVGAVIAAARSSRRFCLPVCRMN